MTMLTRALCVLCVVTVYTGPVGNARYCGGTYDLAEDEVWIAVPVTRLQAGEDRCGDLYYLSGVDYEGRRWSMTAVVRDAGPLAKYCVMLPEGCASIEADVPKFQAPFSGLSSRVDQAINLSAFTRQNGIH